MSMPPPPTLAERLDLVEEWNEKLGRLLEHRRMRGPGFITAALLDLAGDILAGHARRAAEDILARFPEGRAFPLVTHKGRGYFADRVAGRPSLTRFDLVEAADLP